MAPEEGGGGGGANAAPPNRRRNRNKLAEQIGGPSLHQSSFPLTRISVAGPKHTFLLVVGLLESHGKCPRIPETPTNRQNKSADSRQKSAADLGGGGLQMGCVCHQSGVSVPVGTSGGYVIVQAFHKAMVPPPPPPESAILAANESASESAARFTRFGRRDQKFWRLAQNKGYYAVFAV